jgi:hypothetical protein
MSQATESLFAENHEHFFNSIGPSRKSGDVRFCAAVGGKADITRASSSLAGL